MPSLADRVRAKLEQRARTDTFVDALVECMEALILRKYHDDDCYDSTERFKPHEMCECGASAAKDALAKLEKAVGE